jgi:MSHA biogenesis protein MshM
MYESHFGFHEPPFGLTPDPSYFFACPSYEDALNTLLVAAHNGEGFIKIVGEVGFGKTMLCRTFLTRLHEPAAGSEDPSSSAFVTAYLPNPYLDPRGLLVALADEFAVAADPKLDLHMLVKLVTTRLMAIAESGKRALVCLDEVQAMPQTTLEAVRLLTNLETEKRKLLQVVMFGQPELEQRLRQRTTRQLLQRITFQYTLEGLRRDEVAAYLDHRVRVAGYQGETMFTSAAVRILHRASGGTPRLLNVLAHKALMLAFGEGEQEIAGRHAKGAAADTPAARTPGGLLGWLAR